MNRLLVNLPIIIFFAVLIAMMAALHGFRKYRRSKGLRAPFTQKLLRIPGQTLLHRLDKLNAEINVYLIYIFVLPLITYATILSHWVYTGIKPHLLQRSVLSIICLAFVGYSLFKLMKLLSYRRNIRLGYEGELVVGQELHKLQLEGYRIYHDFPADKFNIDHIVVGSNGVFTVETKTRSKPTSKNRSADATVTYDGRGLYFPKATDFQTIEQAEQQADWLSNWLTRAIGDPLAVRAVVALPGWFVKRTSSDGIPVVNPKQFSSLFAHIKPRHLPESMLARINHQLEQKCRDIVPAGLQIEEHPAGGKPDII